MKTGDITMRNSQENATRMSTPCIIKGTQSNHGSWHLPQNLQHLESPPMWLAVAWWGLLRKEAISRDDVSQAFHISQRRAGDVLYYLSRHCTQTVISCWKKSTTKTSKGTSIRCRLFITEIKEKPAKDRVKKYTDNLLSVKKNNPNRNDEIAFNNVIKKFLTGTLTTRKLQ